ncbi:MAG: DUF883 family protein [Pseudomonadota bacterium]
MSNFSRPSAISNEFHNFLADIETLVNEATAAGGDELASAREKINDRIASAKASAIHAGDDLSSSASRFAHTANEEVYAEPWKAVGVGAAIGLMVGLLFARR